MNLLRRLQMRLSLEHAQMVMRKECWELVDHLLAERDKLQEELAKAALEHARVSRNLIEKFLAVAMDMQLLEDEEIVPALIAALRDFEDEIARREEHAAY